MNGPRMSSPQQNMGVRAVLAAIVLALLLWELPELPSLQAQSEDGSLWSRPIDLAEGTEGDNKFPTIVADAAGGVHVFWDESVSVNGGRRSWVDYAYWDGKTWSKPIDVFIGSEAWRSAWGARAVVDRRGVLHAIWIDGFELKYAQRHVSSPVSARSWTRSVTLPTLQGSTIGPAAIAIDDADILHIVYLHAGAPEPGIYYLRSEDGGESWQSPLLLSDQGWDTWPQNQQWYVVALLPVRDTLHVVWYQEGFGAVYMQGEARGQEWSYPELVPQGGKWPNLVALDDNRLLLLTTGEIEGINSICLKLQNLSLDAGHTWSDARQTAQPAKGCLGLVNVLRDRNGGYHMVLSGRTNFLDEPERIWYADGNGEQWNPAQLVTWPGVPYEILGTQPDFPFATISNGNLLHAVFHSDTGQIWYTRRSLSASQVQPIVFPTPTIVPIATPTSTPNNTPLEVMQPTPTSTTRPLPEPLRYMNPQPPPISGIHPILAGGILSAIMLGVIFTWRLLLKNSRS